MIHINGVVVHCCCCCKLDICTTSSSCGCLQLGLPQHIIVVAIQNRTKQNTVPRWRIHNNDDDVFGYFY